MNNLRELVRDIGWQTWLKILAATLFVGVIATLLILLFIPESPVEELLFDFLSWLEGIPPVYGALLMTAVQTVSIILMLPGTPFNLACGFLFTFSIGSIVSVVSADIAAVVSFLLVRYFARGWAERQLEGRPKFKALDAAVNKNGMWLIALIRLSPILPFGLCNYFFGLTNVPFWKYWLSSTLGLAPYTIAYTYLGSLLRDLADIFTEDQDSIESIILLSIGGAVTLITVVLIAIITRKALANALKEHEETVETDVENSEEFSKGMGGSTLVEEAGEEVILKRKEAPPPVEEQVFFKETTPLVPKRQVDSKSAWMQ